MAGPCEARAAAKEGERFAVKKEVRVCFVVRWGGGVAVRRRVRRVVVWRRWVRDLTFGGGRLVVCLFSVEWFTRVVREGTESGMNLLYSAAPRSAGRQYSTHTISSPTSSLLYTGSISRCRTAFNSCCVNDGSNSLSPSSAPKTSFASRAATRLLI